jgi:hypothetical protein
VLAKARFENRRELGIIFDEKESHATVLYGSRMPLARRGVMSAVKSTVWGTIVVVALILVAILAYGSCYSRP